MNEQEEGSNSRDSRERDQSQSSSLIEQANTAAERLEKATEAQRIENDRREELDARARLGGRSESGIQSPEKKVLSEEEKKKQAAIEFFEGSNIAEAIKKYG